MTGTLPRSWVDGTSTSEPRVQTWAFNPTTYILRQSPRTHFEAPFVYLFLGTTHALLVDTGTGNAGLREAVDAVLADRDLDLVVAHTHGHDDHIGGDAELACRPRTTLVDLGRPTPTMELGSRTLDVIRIPGHDPLHLAFYDRATRVLLTGDSLYPGRIYVRDLAAFRGSIERLVAFCEDGHPIAHVLGSHIELSADGTEYPPDATVHPHEHALSLPVETLYDLDATVRAMGAVPAWTRRPHYVVVPAD